jgi:hypothetical protein
MVKKICGVEAGQKLQAFTGYGHDGDVAVGDTAETEEAKGGSGNPCWPGQSARIQAGAPSRVPARSALQACLLPFATPIVGALSILIKLQRSLPGLERGMCDRERWGRVLRCGDDCRCPFGIITQPKT